MHSFWMKFGFGDLKTIKEEEFIAKAMFLLILKDDKLFYLKLVRIWPPFTNSDSWLKKKKEKNLE